MVFLFKNLAPSSTATLTLLVDGRLAGSIIGKAGSTLRALKSSSGARTIQLSQQQAGTAERTVTVNGTCEAVLKAFRDVQQVLHAEARRVDPSSSSEEERVRLLLPNAVAAAVLTKVGLRGLQSSTGARIEVGAHAGGKKQRLVACIGWAEQAERAVAAIVEAASAREAGRHEGFLGQWAFETDYNDHFETPRLAYEHVAPILGACAAQRPGGGGLGALAVYDPYYCQGRVREALAAQGCSRERVLNANRDFYADVAARRVPAHDVLVTNPPYSGDHKQRLCEYLLGAAREAEGARPFLLLLPAWVAGTDYWASFVARLGETHAASPRQRAKADARGAAERRAGVFYLSPKARYAYEHPQAVGHAAAPFHSVWFCGGWPTHDARKAAMRALRPARRGGELEVFRDGAMLQRRGAFTPGSASKREPEVAAAPRGEKKQRTGGKER